MPSHMNFTQDQILQLAPDDASKKAGQQLANAAKWVSRHSHEKALWGDCQGSGSNPYKTMIDLQNLAFKCSCPSRKFPCKHGLGLFLLYVNQRQLFTQESDLAAPVLEWLNKRESKVTSNEAKPAKPVDEKAQQKRAESREKKVEAGLEELSIWLKDVVRSGIMNVPQNPYKFNQAIIARMVDAQAGGIANRLRKLNDINYYQDGWQMKLTQQLASIHFLCEAYQQKASLDDYWQQELMTQIGYTTTKESVLLNEAIQDQWIILSKTMDDDAGISTEKIWLWGSSNKRFALFLNFYAGNQLPQHIYIEGSILNAELVFYPAIQPLRAVLKNQVSQELNFKYIEGYKTMNEVLYQVSNQLSTQPFNPSMPFVLNNMYIVLENQLWYLKDDEHNALLVSNASHECWKVTAISRGETFSCFALYENNQLNIHSIWIQQNFFFIK